MKIIRLTALLSVVFMSYIETSFAVGGKELEKGQENTNILLSFFSTDLLLNIVFAIITIVFTFAFAKFSTAKMTNYLETTYAGAESGREELVGVVSRTLNISILSIGFAITLTILGVDMGIFLGGLGFGIGFTLKIFLTNFIAGILMVTQGFYHLGDIVEVGGKTGTIKNIYSLFTAIEQFDGVIFYVPNVKFLENEVSNFHSNDKRRVEVIIGVDYNTDIVKAKNVMLKVVEQFPNVLQAPGADVLVTSMGDSTINLSLRFWVNSKDGFFVSKSNVTETINMAFKQAGIVIAFPQLTLSSRSDFMLNKNK